MKRLIALLFLVSAQSSFAAVDSVSVQLPEGTTEVVVKALGVEVDDCNIHGLELFQDGDIYHLGIISTEIACSVFELVRMDFETRLEVNGEGVKFNFNSLDASEVVLEFE